MKFQKKTTHLFCAFLTGFSFLAGFIGVTEADPEAETEAEVDGDSGGTSSAGISFCSSSNGGLLELDGIGIVVSENAKELEPGAPGKAPKGRGGGANA